MIYNTYKYIILTISSMAMGACILIPGDIGNVKKILIGLSLLLGMPLIAPQLIKKKNYYITFYGVLFPIILTVISIAFTQDVINAIRYTYFFYLILFIFIFNHYNYQITKVILIFIDILVFITCIVALLDILEIISIKELVFIYGTRDDFSDAFGMPNYSEGKIVGYKVYFRTSALLVLAFFYHLMRKKYIMSMIAGASCILSGTRANLVFIPTIVYTLLLFSWFKGNIFKFYIKTLIIFGTIGILLYFTNDIYYSLFVSDFSASSNHVRYEHIISIMSLIDESPYILLFGNGMGSYFYTSGFGKMTQIIEWSYLDALRSMGIPLFVLFLNFLLRPLFYNNISNWIKAGYIAFLLIAGTNPILMSTTGSLGFLFIFGAQVSVKNEKKY